MGLCVLRSGRILITDYKSNRIRLIDPAARSVCTIAGCGESKDTDGEALTSAIKTPGFLALDLCSVVPDSVVYITTGLKIRRLTLFTGRHSLSSSVTVEVARLIARDLRFTCRTDAQGVSDDRAFDHRLAAA